MKMCHKCGKMYKNTWVAPSFLFKAVGLDEKSTPGTLCVLCFERACAELGIDVYVSVGIHPLIQP